MNKAISLIYRKLTQNEFKAITNTINSVGGGSQTYIDLPKGSIKDSDLQEFFDNKGVQNGNSFTWNFNVNSLSLGRTQQKEIISSRRDSSNCLREQNNENRIEILKPENSGFPTEEYDYENNPIILFILKDDVHEYWAGWFYLEEMTDKWYLNKALARILYKDCGYVRFDVPVIFNLNNYKWPFGELSDKKRTLSLTKDCIYRQYITAIKSKPFLLLAGISGTGKSRIIRELARACWGVDSEEYQAQKPKNFEMVQVKPNWHDSSELIGYVSRVGEKPEYVAGDFLKFVAKAWENQDTPYFLCLDEMNLAPVEQYFAEYLSVIESRKCQENGVITTDPILKKVDAEWYYLLTGQLTTKEDLRIQFNTDGIAIPQNLIVIGTVNMDETTFSFSRKVLDRAMTIEMNEVDLYGGLTYRYEQIGKLNKEDLVAYAVEGVDVYADRQDVCNKVLEYLKKVNTILHGTPFKVAYRTRNEFLLYIVNNLPYNKDNEGNDIAEDSVIARALDEITSMKILSRIEGDDTKVTDALLNKLKETITSELTTLDAAFVTDKSVSLTKLKEMALRLKSGYTSFWS